MSAAGDFACCVAHFADDISIFKMLHKLKKKSEYFFCFFSRTSYWTHWPGETRFFTAHVWGEQRRNTGPKASTKGYILTVDKQEGCPYHVDAQLLTKVHTYKHTYTSG